MIELEAVKDKGSDHIKAMVSKYFITEILKAV
jgi:hypothetical protein